MLATLQQTGSKAAALGSFIYPSSMVWSGRGGGGFISMAPRNHPWRNIDPLDNSAVMNCLAWICRNFGQGVLHTVREQRDGSLKAVDTPGFLDLIYKPNPHHTAMQFWSGTMLSYHLDGNAYWIKVRNARGFGGPTELWYEPHWSIQPHWPQDGSVFIDYYERRVNGTIQQIPVENVVHFRNGINPGNIRYGMAPLKVALLEVFTDQEAAAYTAALLKNMAIPGVVINPTTPIGLTPEKAEAIKQKWATKFGGDNRGEPLLLDFEAEVTTIGFSPSEMDFTEVRRIGEERISGCFGLPAIVAGLGAGLDASTYNNLKELKKSAFEDCLAPTWDSIAETLTSQLLPDFVLGEDGDRICDFDLTQIAALKEDEDKKNQRTVERLRAGAITVNEARTDLGYLPDPEANYYLLPNNVRPVTAAIAMARAGQEIEDPQSQPFGRVGEDAQGGKWFPPAYPPIEIVVRAEPEPLLLTDGSKKKAYEWGGLTLRRKPTQLEQVIDIKAIDGAMRRGALSFGSILLGLREAYIKLAVDGLEGLAAENFHELVISVGADDAEQIQGLAEEQYLLGADLIAEELQRQQPGLGDAVTDAVGDAALRLLGSLSKVTVSRLANDVQARAIAAAQQAALLGVEDMPAAVYSSMREGSKAYVDRAARAAANTSLAAGRRDEIKARPEDIRIVVYSAVLDANTCEPCGEADGETGAEDEITRAPNPECPGGGECRCVHIAVADLSPVPTGTGADARVRFGEISAEFERETEDRRDRRRALLDEWAGASARRQAEIEREITALDRFQAAAEDDLLDRYRSVLHQDSAASFTVVRKGTFDQFTDRYIDEGVAEFQKFIGAGKLDGQTINFHSLTALDDRSYYWNGGVYLDPTGKGSTVAHELGHLLEEKNPAIHDEILKFYARRTQGDPVELLQRLEPNANYKPTEKTKKDKFVDPYIGKLYLDSQGNQLATEVLAIALEYFYRRPNYFAAEDPDFFDFIYELLRR